MPRRQAISHGRPSAAEQCEDAQDFAAEDQRMSGKAFYSFTCHPFGISGPFRVGYFLLIQMQRLTALRNVPNFEHPHSLCTEASCLSTDSDFPSTTKLWRSFRSVRTP
jgi:hypothetical protein